ncbi:hypothetical protein [Plantactinospora sp. GCM10030261]|uniref:hypothetical protein n=1 Tax=Plantactinospora sp. GCM10030261 TaxID=3273420 RepID=UPI00361F1FB2
MVMPLLAVGLVVVTGPAAPAHAGGPGDPIIGDFDGDGITDVAVPVETPGNSIDCQLRVDPGHPTAHVDVYTYLVLPEDGYCPDMGTAGEVDESGVDEIILTWFAGPPPIMEENLLTLRHYEVVHEGFGLFQPSFIGSADINGDGFQDVYEWTDQGEGYVTFLSDGEGSFDPGPERWCANPLSVDVRPMDPGAGADALISYIERCDDFSSGVVVVLDDGDAQVLQSDPQGLTTWTAEVVPANADRYPDVRTVNNETGQVQYFLNTGTGYFLPVTPQPTVAPKATR